MRIEKIFINKFSSDYGENNSSFGQPMGVKSIVILSIRSSTGLSRSHELYLGIYVPEIIETLVNYISPFYLNKEINEELLFNEIGIPFACNTGIYKSIKGAIDSCILQLHFSNCKITLVDGLKKLLLPDIRRLENKKKIKYYASGGSVAYSEQECIKDLNFAIDNNFNGFKMRCGFQSFQDDFSRVKAINTFIKKENSLQKFSLMIDFIQGTLNPKFSIHKLKDYFTSYEIFDILWFEEPLNPDACNLYKNLPQKILNKSCLGESFTSLNEYISFENLLSRFQIDVTHLAGFQEAIKVLNYFSKFRPQTSFTSHIWGSKLSLLLNLALCRAASSIEWFEVPILEFEVNKHLFKKDIFNIDEITDKELDILISKINLDESSKYKFKEGSGYRIG